MSTALQIESQRRAESFARHQERIQWLEAPNPTWACGTPVKPSERFQMLNQSKQIVEFHAKHYGSAA